MKNQFIKGVIKTLFNDKVERYAWTAFFILVILVFTCMY